MREEYKTNKNLTVFKEIEYEDFADLSDKKGQE